MRSFVSLLALSVVALATSACSKKDNASAEPTSPTSATASAAVSATPPERPATEVTRAEVGKPAPDFELKDLDGNVVKLSSFLGKTVVLEWFNPKCPYVNNAHTKGSLVDAAARHTKSGVVWLAINSNAAGKQGHGADVNREGAKTFGMTHPILLDEAGAVGKSYGATNTPHMMVIDPKGVLVYRGAIDNSPDGEGASPENGKLVSYVDAALADLAAGRPVATPETKAYGCSVKFAN